MKRRRRYPRISLRLPLPVLLTFSGREPRDGWGVIYDLSVGGIRIETRSAVEAGQTVFASFTVVEGYSFVNAKGTVRRVTGDGTYYTCGIEFESVVDKQHLKDALTRLIDIEQDITA